VVDLDSISTINKIAEKAAPGRQPAFIAAHVLKAVEIIASGLGVGRQQLAKELGLGEGTTRTIVKRFRDEGLIEVTRRGMTLTDRSNTLLNDIRKRISSTELSQAGITVGACDYAVLVKGVTSHVKSGVEQRDSALMAGAKGATTLVYRGNQFHVPGVEVEPSVLLVKELISRLKPEEGDIVIIGTANSILKAELGAKAAALEMLERVTSICSINL
jgi:DNA-binding transcriptional regulator LsrR (DeoR family)